MKDRRTVIVDEIVRDAYRRGRKNVEVGQRDIITALARETAERLKIEFIHAPVEKPVVYRTGGATATRRILYRNNPRWIAPGPIIANQPKAISKLAFVGAGGVGVNLVHLAANRNLANEIALIDVLPGHAEAIALDLQHASGVTEARTRVAGSTSLSLVADAQIVVVTAGRPRTPGMNRSDLRQVNGRVIRSIGENIASLAPNSVIIVVTNPVEEMTQLMLDATGFDRKRVFGMAGTLDSARFRTALAQAADVSVADVDAMTLGSHGDEMVAMASKATIKGRPICDFLNAAAIEACRQKTIDAGASIVNLRKTGSATLAPAHATLEIIDYMRGICAGNVPVSVRLDGEYGISDTVLGVPCNLGITGILEITEISMTQEERSELKHAAAAIRERMNGK